MAAEITSLAVVRRQHFGKQTKSRRRQGLIPANLVSPGKPSAALEVSANTLKKVLDQVGYTQPVELVIEKKTKAVALVTEVQFQPASPGYVHVVFSEIKKGKTVTVDIPLLIEGGDHIPGGMVVDSSDSILVTADAFKLPEVITIDVGHLEDETMAVRVVDLNLPDGVTTAEDPQKPLARLVKSRASVAQEEEAEASTDEDLLTDADAESGDSEDDSGQAK